MGKTSVTEFYFLRYDYDNNSRTTMRPISSKILSEVDITSIHKCYISSDLTEHNGISQNGTAFFLEWSCLKYYCTFSHETKNLKQYPLRNFICSQKILGRCFGDTFDLFQYKSSTLLYEASNNTRAVLLFFEVTSIEK